MSYKNLKDRETSGMTVDGMLESGTVAFFSPFCYLLLLLFFLGEYEYRGKGGRVGVNR
jgi:hypothetical protein